MTAEILSSLKVNLGIRGDGYDTRLEEVIRSAEDFIEMEGLILDPDSDGDRQIVVMYAEHLWRHRETGEEMPRMLRRALNNRLFSQRMGG